MQPQNLLVSRKVYDDYPARIEYTLTEYSNSVTEVLVAMEKWGKQHRDLFPKNRSDVN